MTSLGTLWQFSRPHTVKGSVISVLALCVLCGNHSGSWAPWWLLWVALVSAVACNMFITGINQVTDVSIDRVNKPYLPLAAGSMHVREGYLISTVSLVVALVTAGLGGARFAALIATIALCGALYSLPPIRLKQRHQSAAFSIVLVRGFLINWGFFALFTSQWSLAQVPGWLWSLVIFVVAYSIAIAWVKDIPDAEGDSKARIRTYVMQLGAGKTLKRSAVVVFLGAVLAATICILSPATQQPWAFAAVPVVVATGYGMLALKIQPQNRESIRAFYRWLWRLFYLFYAGMALVSAV